MSYYVISHYPTSTKAFMRGCFVYKKAAENYRDHLLTILDKNVSIEVVKSSQKKYTVYV